MKRTMLNESTQARVAGAETTGGLEAALRVPDAAALPPGLHARVMAAVHAADAAGVPAATVPFRMAWAVGLAAACAAAALGIAHLRSAHLRREAVTAGASLATVPSQLLDSAARTPALVADPLEREIDNVAADVQRTARFLVAQLETPGWR